MLFQANESESSSPKNILSMTGKMQNPEGTGY